jgi:hypothetical protein
MSRITGYVDGDGEFRQRIEFKMKNDWDLRELNGYLEDPSAGVIKERFDDEKAVITVRAKW